MESNTCIKPMVSAQHMQLINLHKHYKNGHLAVIGGILDQPNYYLDAMLLIDGMSHGN